MNHFLNNLRKAICEAVIIYYNSLILYMLLEKYFVKIFYNMK